MDTPNLTTSVESSTASVSIPVPAATKPYKPRYTLAKLTRRHHLMMKRFVQDGARVSEIQIEFNISYQRLSILRNQPLWQEAEEKLRKEMLHMERVKLEALTGAAVQTLGDKLDSTDERIQLSSAKDILDRVGLKDRDEQQEATFQQQINLYIPKNWQGKVE